MAKVIKINESSFKKLLEYIGDAEEYGLYDNDEYNMPENELNNIRQQRDQWNADYEDDMKDMADSNEADLAIMNGHFDNAYDPGGYL